MTVSELKYLVLSDLYRITGSVGMKAFLKQFFFGESYPYVLWMRVAAYLRGKGLAYLPFFIFAKWRLRRQRYRLGIAISETTQIGSGFYIGYFGAIIVNDSAVIGKNCNISQGVTIGQVNRGGKKGTPELGDNVYIGPGAKIIGGIKVGSNVAIGANAVVTKDIPDGSVVVGMPAKVISNEGSEGYVNRTSYDELLK